VRKSSIILAVAAVLGSLALAITVAIGASHLRPGGDSREAAIAAVTSVSSNIAAPGAAAPAIVKFASDPALAPPIDLKDLAGDQVSLANYQGKVILLSFWATWCPPCRMEIPELVDLQKKYPDKLQIIGISMDDAETPADVKHVQEVAAELHINYPVVIATPKLADSYGGVPALPTTFVLNPSDRVIQKHTGLLESEIYDNEVRLLANLPVNAKVETFRDTGQVFLTNASKATELPGVDFKDLTPEQKREALKRMNSIDCNCGCGLTVAECRMNDSSCDISKALSEQIIKDVKAGVPSNIPAPDTPTGQTASK
jgi:thiol-disulfide isomerase/thioredoxin